MTRVRNASFIRLSLAHSLFASLSRLQQWKYNSTITGCVSNLPYVGPVGAKKFRKAGFTNVETVFAHYLSFKGPSKYKNGELIEVPLLVVNGRFWMWLLTIGITHHRTEITECMAWKVRFDARARRFACLTLVSHPCLSIM